jgi:hypothetical protein
MKRLQFTWKYGLAIIGVLILAYLVMGFNSRMARLRQLRVQYEAVNAQLDELQRENHGLETQIAEATSNAPVSRWAYEEGHMIQPGDQPIVPLAPGESTPAPTPKPQTIQRPVKNWQMWLLLFVDSISP